MDRQRSDVGAAQRGDHQLGERGRVTSEKAYSVFISSKAMDSQDVDDYANVFSCTKKRPSANTGLGVAATLRTGLFSLYSPHFPSKKRDGYAWECVLSGACVRHTRDQLLRPGTTTALAKFGVDKWGKHGDSGAASLVPQRAHQRSSRQFSRRMDLITSFPPMSPRFAGCVAP